MTKYLQSYKIHLLSILLLSISRLGFSQDITTSLINYYPLNGNANDSTINNLDGTVTGAMLTNGFDGVADGGYALDGGDDIRFGDAAIGQGSFTVAFWVRIPNGLAQDETRNLISKRSSCTEGRLFEIAYRNSSTEGHRISVGQRDNAGIPGPVAANLTVGDWMHVAYIKNNATSSSSLYINGALASEVAWNRTSLNLENNGSIGVSNSPCIGADGTLGMIGDIDELRVYDRVLSMDDIDAFVNPQIVLTDPIGTEINSTNTIQLFFPELLNESTVNTSSVSVTAATSGAAVHSVSVAGSSLSITPSAPWPVNEDLTISITGIETVRGEVVPDEDVVFSVVPFSGPDAILSYPISGNANDVIGNIANQNGTISGAIFATGSDGDPFGALSFDGIDDLVTFGDAPISTGSFSISVRVNVPADGSTTANTVILSKREACTEGRSIEILYQRSGDKVRFATELRSNAGAGSPGTDFNYDVDTWHDVTLVVDNEARQNRLIVNGVVAGEVDWVLGSQNFENDAAIRLGFSPCNNADGRRRFDGLVEALNIFDQVVEADIDFVTPGRNTTDVAVDTDIALLFNQPLNVNTINTSTLVVTDDDGTVYPYTFTTSNFDQELLINPDNDFPKGKEIIIQLSDLQASGGFQYADVNLSFTTVQTQLLSHSELNGLSNVATDTTISFKFDNTVDAASLNQGIVVIGDQHGPVEGSFSMPEPDSVVFTPTIPYFSNEMITVYVNPNLLDVGGESISNLTAFKFHVASQSFTDASLSYRLTQLSTPVATSSPRNLIPADIDNDGDLDLIGGDDNPGTLFWFENIGSGNYGAGQIIDNNNGYFDIKVTDFDADGDLDIITADRSVSQGIYWYENDGAANFTEQLIISLPNSDSRSIAVADYNNDGDLDVAVASFGSDRFHVFNRNGNQLFAAANANDPIFINDADWNGDGNLDIIAGNFGGSVVRWTNSGVATFSGATIQSASQVRSVAPIDIDQDGDLDIVYSAQSANQIGVLRNDGSAVFTNIQVGSVIGPHRIDVGDADGDGDLDILYTTAGTGADINFHYLENSGTLTLWVSNRLIPTASFGGIFSQTAKYADIDNDGDLDVVATDANTGFYIFENLIVDLNSAPIVANAIADQSLTEDDGDPVLIDVSQVFSDPEGDAFTVMASADNPAVTTSITDDILTLTVVTPDFFGEVEITVTADDGNGTNSDVFTFEVTPVNDAPLFDLSSESLLVDEDFTTTELITVTQNQPANEDAPTYSLSPSSVSFASVSIDSNTGEITVEATANGFGTQVFTVTANDGATENNIATQTFTLTVNPVNDAPEVTGNFLLPALMEDDMTTEFLNVAQLFTDPDNDPLTFSVSEDPNSNVIATINESNVLEVTPAANFNGEVDFTLTATDGSESTSTIIQVTILAINDSPTFTTSGDLNLQTDFTGTEIVTVTPEEVPSDEISQAVTYSLSPAMVTFANVSINSTTGEVSVTSVMGAEGTQEFTITADDGQAENNLATQNFTLNVINNLAPVVDNAISDTNIQEDQATLSIVDVTTVFSDPENDPLTFSIMDDFEGAVNVTINGNSLEVTPSLNYNGAGTITLTASDANQSTATSFSLTVNAVNDAPVVSNTIADQSTNEDVLYQFEVPGNVFSDVDNNTLVLSLTNAPDWLTLNGSVLSGTPENDDVGTISVTVQASDGELSVADEFQLTVVNENDAPEVAVSIAPQNLLEDSETLNFDLTNVFTDVDNDALTYQLVDNTNMAINAQVNGNELSIGPLENLNGAGTVTFSATDGQATTSTSIEVTVAAVNDAPVFTLSETSLELSMDFEAVNIMVQPGTVPSDEIDQEVTYSLNPSTLDFANITINSTTGEVTINSINGAFGEETITVVANDGQGENNTAEATFSLTVLRPVSVNNDPDFFVVIYPNPAKEFIQIDLNGQVVDKASIINLEGKELLNIDLGSGQVDVSRMSNGLYLIKIESNNSTYLKKFIKE